MLSNVWFIIVSSQYAGLAIIFTALPINIQWLMAIILPVFRHANAKVYLKLLEKYAGRDNKMAVIRTSISISVDYSLFIAIKLSSATELTLFTILGFEFLLNIYLCYKIKV